MQGPKKFPVRTCIACRAEKPKRELCRIVKNADGIFLDATGKCAGRGAYICRSEECAKKLVQKKLLSRAFSEPVPQETYEKIEADLRTLCGDAQ